MGQGVGHVSMVEIGQLVGQDIIGEMGQEVKTAS